MISIPSRSSGNPTVIRFYVDAILYKTRTRADLPAGTSWVFDHPFFIILNVAVGGGWPGTPMRRQFFRNRCRSIMSGSINGQRDVSQE